MIAALAASVNSTEVSVTVIVLDGTVVVPVTVDVAVILP